MQVLKWNCAFLPPLSTQQARGDPGCRERLPEERRLEAGSATIPSKAKRARSRMKAVLALFAISMCSFSFGPLPAHALDPSLDVSQYAHTAWKIREGFVPGVIHQIAQTPDGYLWLASDFGLIRFDGVRTVPWQPPAGERLPSNDVRGVMVARDDTLWLGTAKGLVSFKNGRLVRYPELDGHDVYALFEDHDGTVWAGGVVWEGAYAQPGKLCAIKDGSAECYGSDGSFGSRGQAGKSLARRRERIMAMETRSPEKVCPALTDARDSKPGLRPQCANRRRTGWPDRGCGEWHYTLRVWQNKALFVSTFRTAKAAYAIA